MRSTTASGRWECARSTTSTRTGARSAAAAAGTAVARCTYTGSAPTRCAAPEAATSTSPLPLGHVGAGAVFAAAADTGSAPTGVAGTFLVATGWIFCGVTGANSFAAAGSGTPINSATITINPTPDVMTR